MRTITKNFVYIIEPLKIVLFNAVIALLGVEYEGSESSSLYTVTMVLLFGVSTLLYLSRVLKRGTIRKDALIVMGVIVLYILLSTAFFVGRYGYNYRFVKYTLFFFLFAFPAMLWGTEFVYDHTDNLQTYVKWFEVILFVMSLFCVIAVLTPVLQGNETLRGESYQSNSYYCAFTFGGQLYYAFNKNNENRFAFFQTKIVQLIRVVLLCALPICVISTGGKGGLVLVFCYILLMFIYVTSTQKAAAMRLAKILVAGAMVVLVVAISSWAIGNSEFLKDSFEGMISYLDFQNNTIDMTHTSNRDLVYAQALELIGEKPFFGYGVLGYMPLLTTTYQYPHNLFLEIALQGGLFVLLAAVGVLLIAIYKLYKMIKDDKNNWIFAFIFTYPLVQLMFSGSYLLTGLFWFCMAIFLTYRPENNRKGNEQERML